MSEERIEPAIVIGLGVGGVTASIYLSRMGIQPLAFEGGQIGGHVLKLETIDDYSGFKGSGRQLADEFEKQLKFNNIEVVNEYVLALYKNSDGLFIVKTKNGEYKTKAVVIASGLKSKSTINFNGIEVMDNPLLDIDRIKDKKVAVVGGGKVAYMGALSLSKQAKKVYIIRDNIEAPSVLVKEVESLENVEISDSIPEDVDRIYDLPSKSRMIGNTDFCLLKEIVDDQDNIAVGKDCQTFVKGAFACGDVVQKSLKTLATAVYDGAIAGVMIYRLLTGMDQVS